MQYMIIEHFRDGGARPVYERFRERGRLAPEGLHHVGSWVTAWRRRERSSMELQWDPGRNSLQFYQSSAGLGGV